MLGARVPESGEAGDSQESRAVGHSLLVEVGYRTEFRAGGSESGAASNHIRHSPHRTSTKRKPLLQALPQDL